jgi:hypothetical protein
MKSIKIHKEWQVWFADMTNDEKASILDNIMRCLHDEEPQFVTTGDKIVWKQILPAIEKDMSAYNKRKQNIKKAQDVAAGGKEITAGGEKAPAGDVGFSSTPPVASAGPKSWQHILDNLGKAKPDDDWVVSDSNDDW